MANKAHAQQKKRGFKEEVIQFDYQSETYTERIGDGLILTDLSVSEIKDMLNEIPGKLSYWKSVQVNIEIDLEEAEQNYEAWYAEKYLEVNENDPKSTEGKKKNKVILDYYNEYVDHQNVLMMLREAKGKCQSIVKGLEIQSWTLRAIANLTESEMSNIEARGRRSLDDLT